MFTERSGVNSVAQTVNDMRCLWRELTQHDIGIDGHIEYVSPTGLASGQIVAVQVKSGASYVTSAGQDYSFLPDRKHVAYWRSYPLPVILVLHDPATARSYWTFVKPQLEADPTAPIRISRDNQLVAESARQIFPDTPEVPVSNQILLAEMLANRYLGPGSISFFTMFCNGMTDLARKVYVGMDLFEMVLEEAWHLPEFGPVIDQSSYVFLDAYVSFLIRNDLCVLSYGDYWEALEERQMVGTFIAPLTEKGLALRSFISQLDRNMHSDEGARVLGLIQERPVHMVFFGSGIMRLSYIREAEERYRDMMLPSDGLNSSGS